MFKKLTLLLSVLFILLFPQTTFAQSLTATLTGPNSGTINQPVRFSATASGNNLSKIQIYAARTDADLSTAAP